MTIGKKHSTIIGSLHSHYDKAVAKAFTISFKYTTDNCKPPYKITVCLGLFKQIMSIPLKVT